MRGRGKEESACSWLTAWEELCTVVTPLLSVRSTGSKGEPLAKVARPSVHS